LSPEEVQGKPEIIRSIPTHNLDIDEQSATVTTHVCVAKQIMLSVYLGNGKRFMRNPIPKGESLIVAMVSRREIVS
jgi:hypothetical protein